jgi:cytoskeletal protein RodZ
MSKFTKYWIGGLVLSACMLTLTPRQAWAGDDVFVDEGEGDFESLPVTSTTTPANKAEIQDALDVPTVAAPPAPAKSAAKSAAKTEKVSAKSVVKAEPVIAPVEKVVEVKPAQKVRQPASTGMYVATTKSCPITPAMDATAEPLSFTKFPRKIWVERADGGWYKVHTKSGDTGYLAPECAH